MKQKIYIEGDCGYWKVMRNGIFTGYWNRDFVEAVSLAMRYAITWGDVYDETMNRKWESIA